MNLAADLTKSSEAMTIDFERYTIKYNNTVLPISLTLAEFKILALLVNDPGYVRSRRAIINVIAPGTKIIERNVDVHIRSLRKKLGPLGENLLTIRGLGYKWREKEYDRFTHSGSENGLQA